MAEATVQPQSKSKGPSAATSDGSIWILGPQADLTLIVGAPVIIFVGIMAAKGIWDAAAISSFIMIWAIGHHLPGMMRAYGDPSLFRRFWVRFTIAPLFLLAVCGFTFWTTVNSGVIAIAAVWGWWHYMMQGYGFVRIYDSKVGSFAATTRWLDHGMCLTWFLAAVVLNDNALYEFIENFYSSGFPVPSPAVISSLKSIVSGATAAVTVLFVINMVVRYRRGERPSPIKPLLMLATFGAFWYSAATVTNIIVAYAFFELFHDVQYLTIVWAFNRSRVAKDRTLTGFTKFLFQPRFWFVVLYVLLVFAYGSLKWGSQYVNRVELEKILAAVFLASTLLHYYFDGFIWKLRESGTQSSLQIETQQRGKGQFRIPIWMRHSVLWMLFVLPLGYLTVSQVQDALARRELPVGKQRQQILEESRKLAECTPNSINANFTLGLAYEANELLDEAAGAYQAALEIFPDHVASKTRLGVVTAKTSSKPATK
ncbi:MAG: hypothetical protein GY768_26835 [Planctomycetaceae bacterium]|nr:hypothetical protein [Planctomycetaceae bacterium]